MIFYLSSKMLRTVVWLVLFVLFRMMFRRVIAIGVCLDDYVPEKTISKMLEDDFSSRSLHRSFNLIPPLRKNLEERTSEGGKFLSRSPRVSLQYLLYGEKADPQTLDDTAFNVIERSTCPWSVYMDVDEDRLPKTMAIARCRCNECIGQANNLCMPVYSYPIVFRRHCVDGHYKYEPVTGRYPVGCTCVVKRQT